MLETARGNLKDHHDDVEFREGELDALPLADGEVDAVVAGMVVHHVPDLQAFLLEAHRVLKPGGVLVIEDLLPHREGWMREHMADLRLGLDPESLEARLTSCGFETPIIEPIEDSYTPQHPNGEQIALPLFVLRTRKRRPETGVTP